MATPSASGSSDVIGAAGTNRLFVAMTGTTGGASTERWALGANGDSEGVRSTGSDFIIERYDNAGRPIDAPLLDPARHRRGDLRRSGGVRQHRAPRPDHLRRPATSRSQPRRRRLSGDLGRRRLRGQQPGDGGRRDRPRLRGDLQWRGRSVRSPSSATEPAAARLKPERFGHRRVVEQLGAEVDHLQELLQARRRRRWVRRSGRSARTSNLPATKKPDGSRRLTR